jgi:hypothetical protein
MDIAREEMAHGSACDTFVTKCPARRVHCSYVPMFGDLDYDPSMDYSSVPLEEQLEAVRRAVRCACPSMALLEPDCLLNGARVWPLPCTPMQLCCIGLLQTALCDLSLPHLCCGSLAL